MKAAALLTLEIRHEHDIVSTRQRARQIGALLGFDGHDQARIATAVSELARNAFQYAGGGKAQFAVGGDPAALRITLQDEGPGIPHLEEVLDGKYASETGLGLGIAGARRLLDELRIETEAGRGTTVVAAKVLPRRAGAPTSEVIARIAAELARKAPESVLEELQQQNQELLRTLTALRAREAELAIVNRELEDTNRGVVALYSELVEKADTLQRVSEVKTRFLSNMTHEFRTPLNSILGLSRLLTGRFDGDLTVEQEKQVGYIQKSAETLSELVNDLLDLAKAEAGKLTVRVAPFEVTNVFAALRGMMRPLLSHNGSVSLVFEEPAGLPRLCTDEGKVSQILRNLVSNALKFTERGEIRVRAALLGGGMLQLSVADTGIGIPPEHRERIFEEFTQIESHAQAHVGGTGLGLPLSRRLATLLGGRVWVESELGVGSTFHAEIPVDYPGSSEAVHPSAPPLALDATRLPVLFVEDSRESMLIYERYLRGSPFQLVPARTTAEARRILGSLSPAAVVLDILLEGESAWSLLSELRSAEATRDTPILVITMIENEAQARRLGASAFRVKPAAQDWLVATLMEVTHATPRRKILIVDDDEVARYLLRGLLAGRPEQILEARGGEEGLRQITDERPDIVFLDLSMSDMSGFEVLERMRSDPRSRDVPVVVYTSRALSESELARIEGHAVAVLSKESPSREAAAAAVTGALALAGLD